MLVDRKVLECFFTGLTELRQYANAGRGIRNDLTVLEKEGHVRAQCFENSVKQLSQAVEENLSIIAILEQRVQPLEESLGEVKHHDCADVAEHSKNVSSADSITKKRKIDQ